MDEEDQFIPDLNALLEVSLVEENVPSSNSEETQTTDEKKCEETEEFFSQRPDGQKSEKDEGDDKQPTEAEDKPQVSAETPAPAVAEPVPNGTQVTEQFKLPDLSNATDQQKELHNFKISLLPKDISEEEKSFYLNAIDDIKSVTCMRLHCTVCNEHIGCQPEAEDNTFSHINLHVLMCKQCYEFYGNGDFTVGADGSETYCFWCGQGGQVFCCSTCTHVFCKKCVRLNFGRKVQKEIDDSSEWSCYACNPKTLWEFRAQCWGLFTFNEMRKNDLVSFTSAEELRLPGYNIVECCSIQRRAGKPLKIISFRYLLPKKQEENKEKEVKNDTVNNKNKPITSNGKVTYPLKILPKILRAEGDPVIPSTKEESSAAPVPTALTPALKILPNMLTVESGPVIPSTNKVSSNPPVPTALTPAIKVRTPGTVNAAVFPSPVTPQVHPTSEIIVRPSGNGGVNTTQRVNYVASTSLKNNERRTPVQRKAGGSYVLAGNQSGNSTLVPFNSVNVQKPAKEVNQTGKQPVTYDVDDDDDVVIIDEAFDSAVKKMELEWFVTTLEQAEKVSKTFHSQFENVKQSFMSEVKSNKIDAKRIRSFSGKMHSLFIRTAVKLACLDDKHITEAFADWLKSEKSKHQKPPPSEPAPKADTECYFDMECCESDNEEAEDDFETVFKKSVLECSETLSDVEFEDDVRNNITSSMQRDRLATLTQQTSSLRKQQCDMCIQTETEEGSSKKEEWSGAFSNFLVNCSESDTSKQNGAPSLNRDKADTEDKSAPPSKKETSDPLIEEVPCDKANNGDKSPPPSENEVSDPLTEAEMCDQEKSPPPSENEVSDPLLETEKEYVEENLPPPSEIEVVDPLMETSLCNKEKSPLPSETEVSDPLMQTSLHDNANVEENSQPISEIEVSDPLNDTPLCDNANVEEKSPPISEIEVSDPLNETPLCDNANDEEKSPPISEIEVSDPLNETPLCDNANDEEKSPPISEIEVSDPLNDTPLCDNANDEEKSPPISEIEVSDPLMETALHDNTNVEKKSPPISENEVLDPLNKALRDNTNVEKKSQPISEMEVSDPLMETALHDNTNVEEKSPPVSKIEVSGPPLEEVSCDKLRTENKLSLPSENESRNPLIKTTAPAISEVPRKGESLKRACSSSPSVESKIRKLESRCRNTSLKTETENDDDDDDDKYRKYGLKNFIIKLKDIDTKE